MSLAYGGEVERLELLGIVEAHAKRIRSRRIPAERRKIKLLWPPKTDWGGARFCHRGSFHQSSWRRRSP